MGLEHLERLLDQIAEDEALSLVVLDLVADVEVAQLVEVEHRQDLPVVGHQGLADGVRASHEGLQDLQRDGDDLSVSGVEGRYTHESGAVQIII